MDEQTQLMREILNFNHSDGSKARDTDRGHACGDIDRYGGTSKADRSKIDEREIDSSVFTGCHVDGRREVVGWSIYRFDERSCRRERERLISGGVSGVA